MPVRRPTVDPAFTFGCSLVLSLVLWWGTLQGLLDGNVDIVDAGMRYLASLAFAWCAMYFVTWLIAYYASQPRRSPAPPPPPTPARRRDDPREDAAA